MATGPTPAVSRRRTVESVDTADRPGAAGRAWLTYVSEGRAHFYRVGRSWNVFGRNAGELIGLLRSVETDVRSSLRLMQDPPAPEDEEEYRFHTEFWQQMDQRLHNMLSSAVSLVDHTRPLIKFYSHEADFSAEWATRSEKVATSDRALFLRKLRNYLLHHGMAPLMQTLHLEPVSADEFDHLEIKLSAAGLLAWPDWNAAHRKFISSFEGGPPLRQLTTAYAEDMQNLYMWLLEQQSVLHFPGVLPAHLS